MNNIDQYFFYYKILHSRKSTAFDDEMKNKNKGIYRKEIQKGVFKYYYMDTNKEVSESDLMRIHSLGLAPAYKNVWVSLDPKSKIQATGIDAKGRKQYRYTKKHTEEATKDKFIRLYKFIKVIPKFEKQLTKDFTSNSFSKEKTISLMFYIIRELNIRVGKEHYAKENNSYGMTSLKKSHMKINYQNKIAKFKFKAKSNKIVQYTLSDISLVEELIKLQKLEGDKLFQYVNSNDDIIRVNDLDLNKYIKLNMGKSFTCKDFRTYAANFYFVKALLSETRKKLPLSQKIIKNNLLNAQEHTAFYLRHTKSISKKSYTMDIIRELYIKDPQYFIDNKSKQPLTILIEMLKIFKKSHKL